MATPPTRIQASPGVPDKVRGTQEWDPRVFHDKLHSILVATDLDFDTMDALHALVDDMGALHRAAIARERTLADASELASRRAREQLDQEAAVLRRRAEAAEAAQADLARASELEHQHVRSRADAFDEQVGLMKQLCKELVRSQQQVEQECRLEYQAKLGRAQVDARRSTAGERLEASEKRRADRAVKEPSSERKESLLLHVLREKALLPNKQARTKDGSWTPFSSASSARSTRDASYSGPPSGASSRAASRPRSVSHAAE